MESLPDFTSQGRQCQVATGTDGKPVELHKSAYKPAYKENPKTAENQAQKLPAELTEIVAVWPELPEHIKKALVQTHNNTGVEQ